MKRRKRLKRLLRILLYVAFLVIFTLAAAEILLRFSNQVRQRKNHLEWLRSLMSYHEILGWQHVPNAEVRSVSPEYNVLYKINSKGLRDREYAYEKPRNRYRIICPGDSITFGWGVEADQCFTEQLEKRLPGVDVINMGVQGYGIDQMFLQLREEGMKYRPDLVLIYLIPHDLVRACYSKMWDRPKPRFKLEGGQFYLDNVPVPRVDAFSFENPTFDQLRYILAKKSYLFYFIQDVLYLRKAAGVERQGNRALQNALARAIIMEMKKMTDARGAGLVLIGEFSDRLRAFFSKHHIMHFGNPLTGYRGAYEDIYYDEMEHPNPRGHRLIARGLHARLKEQIGRR
jgi:lysophospholipase L1-like esterase